MAFKSSAGLRLRPAIIALALLVLSPLLFATPPAWWAQRGATNSQPVIDDAVANLGQLKHFAVKARDELNAKLPGGAGTAINEMVESWLLPPAPGTNRNDFLAANLGQLKTVSRPFYVRLQELSYAYSLPWLVSDIPADDYAAANIGQLKNVFSFDLSDGSRLPMPFELIALLEVNEVKLTWQTRPVSPAGTFRIKRWGPTMGLMPITVTVAATQNSYVDSTVQPGGRYYYQVRYAMGTTLSDPSPSVAVRLPGPLIEEGGSGDNGSGYDPDSADSDGDGIPDSSEAINQTNPNLTDSDGDHHDDAMDLFPADSRRSEYVPFKNYGVIDLSKLSINAELVESDNVKTIAINDQGKVSWLNDRTIPTEGAVKRWQTVTTWSDGQPAAQVYNWSDTDSQESLSYDISQITGSGIIGGSWNHTGPSDIPNGYDWHVTRGLPDKLPVPDSFLVEGQTPRDSNFFYLDISPRVALKVTAIAEIQAGYVRGGFLTYPESDYTTQARLLFRNRTSMEYLPSDAPAELNQFGEAVAINRLGHLLIGVTNSKNIYVWDINVDGSHPNGSVSHLGLGIPYAINDRQEVIGNLDCWDPATQTQQGYESVDGNFDDGNGGTRKGRGSLGFYWKPGLQEVSVFHDSLPQKYKKQLRSVVPFSISNADPTTEQVIIMFNAESLEGPSDSPVWVERQFVWKKLPAQEASIEEIVVHHPEEEGGQSAGTMGAVRVFAATRYGTPVGLSAANKPTVNPSFNFRPADGEICRGFDPVIEGDGNSREDRDDKNRHGAWVSVTKSGTSATNDKVVLDIPDAEVRDYRLVVPADFTASLEVTPKQHTKLTSSNQLVLKGKQGTEEPANIAIGKVNLVRLPNANEPNGKIIGFLNVMVLPERVVDIAIYHLKDNKEKTDKEMELNRNLTPADMAALELTAANHAAVENQAIIASLNKIYIQAGIRFVLNVNSGRCDLQYDKNGDGMLESSDRDDAEGKAIFQSTNVKTQAGKMKIFIARAIKNENLGGFCPTVGPKNSVKYSPGRQAIVFTTAFGDTPSFHRAIAHEVGHTLTLATRDAYYAPWRTRTPEHQGHDLGPWPVSVSKGLMDPVNEDSIPWLRNEDWSRANQMAIIYAP